MSSGVFVCVCISEREKSAVPRWEQPHRSSKEKVSRPRTGQPSAGTYHGTPVSLSDNYQLFVSHKVPNDIIEWKDREGKDILDMWRESEKVGSDCPPGHTLVQRSFLPNKNTQMLDMEDQTVD